MYKNGKDYSFDVSKKDPDIAFIVIGGYRLGVVIKLTDDMFDVVDNEENMSYEVGSPEEAVECIKIHYGSHLPKGFTYVPKDWKHPEWKTAGRVHEWKNYVNETVQRMWNEFTDYQKQALAASANDSAEKEHWN